MSVGTGLSVTRASEHFTRFFEMYPNHEQVLKYAELRRESGSDLLARLETLLLTLPEDAIFDHHKAARSWQILSHLVSGRPARPDARNDLVAVEEDLVLGRAQALESDLPQLTASLTRIFESIYGRVQLGQAFAHDVTGFWLCPMSQDWNHESTRSGLQDGSLLPGWNERAWPRFLYPSGNLDFNTPALGFLRNAWLVPCFKELFTVVPPSAGRVYDTLPHPAPRTAPNLFEKFFGAVCNTVQYFLWPGGPHSTGSPSASEHYADDDEDLVAGGRPPVRIPGVTLGSLAYLATLIRYALAEKCYWHPNTHFNYRRFYRSILDWLEDPVNRREVHDLLVWWDEQLFGRDMAILMVELREQHEDLVGTDRDEEFAAKLLALMGTGEDL